MCKRGWNDQAHDWLDESALQTDAQCMLSYFGMVSVCTKVPGVVHAGICLSLVSCRTDPVHCI